MPGGAGSPPAPWLEVSVPMRRPPGGAEPPFLRTLAGDFRRVRDDVRRTGYRESFRRTVADLDEFYLPERSRERLAGMGAVRRWFWRSWWLFKALVLALTPARRVLLLLAFVLLWVASQGGPDVSHPNRNAGLLSLVILLVVLMLELKDKILARDELEDGRAVQRALLPEPSPEVPGWDVWLSSRPANDVGGDLVDLLKLSGERVALVLADVAGKGLGAALLMAKLQATVRALAGEAHSLADLGERVNGILHRDGLPNSFATLVYLDVERESGRIRLVNAGHMPPLVFRGATITELARGGIALGITHPASFEEQTVELGPGETLLVYSDGVTEAMDASGELFGEERLRAILPGLSTLAPREMAARLVAAVDAFVGCAPVHDDLSLLILRRR